MPDNESPIAQYVQHVRATRELAHGLIKEAKPALLRLIHVMRNTTNQSYHVRALLFSLWNGKPTSLIEVVNLDNAVRQNVVAVILAFGLSDGREEFFYDAISLPLKQAGIFEWFTAEGDKE